MDGKKPWLALEIPRSERAEGTKSRSLAPPPQRTQNRRALRTPDTLGMTTLRNR
jgi:hypothetical protein